ncbi:MAG TPA: TlpA disulfide reductase family protein [Pyrinomonadaceae bacterium]|nr:TlpA disulfide reductase family protein [Pyrinomonadaceae bacterium]
MSKLFWLLILAAAAAVNVAPQSGRKITAPRPAPIQPPLNAEPELRPERQPEIASAPAKLSFLPETLRERQINKIEGGSFRFADFQGKVVVINLWASWCGPCRREIPEYEKVRKAYAGRDVEFIGLTTEDRRTSADRVHRFLDSVSFGFRLGWADRETTHALMNGRGAIPQTLVIDVDGRVVNHWTGYSPGSSGDKLKQSIDHALETAKRL